MNINKSSLFYCYLSGLVAFLVTPAYMIGNSPDDFQFIKANTLTVTGLSLSVIFGTILSIIYLALEFIKLKKTAALFSYLTFYWIVVAGLLLPVSMSTGMIDPEKNPINTNNLLLIATGCILVCFIYISSFRKYITTFLVIVIFTSLIPSVISINDSGIMNAELKDNTHPSLSVSKNKNIFVVSFDGVPGSIVADLIRENEKYSIALKDFVFFENAVAQSPATSASIVGEIHGIHDYKSMGESIGDVMESIVSDGLDDDLITNHVPDSYLYNYVVENEKNKIKIPDEISSAQNHIDTFDLYKYPIVRIWTYQALNLFDWNGFALEKLKNAIIPDSISIKSDITNKFINHKGAGWDKKNIQSIDLFNSFVSSLGTNDDKDFSIRYMHFTFTHFPVDFDEHCNYRSYDKSWYNRNQSNEGIKAETICAINTFLSFTQKLKDLNIYNNSLIIFKSDHGKPVGYLSEHPNNLMLNNNTMWGYNRYRPMLMIKNFEATTPEIIIKQDLVLLNDIAKTLCIASKLDLPCSNFNGINLLSEKIETESPYYIYVPQDSGSSFKYGDHISIKIQSRDIPLLDAMISSGQIVTEEYLDKKSHVY